MDQEHGSIAVHERDGVSVVVFLEFSVLDRTHIDRIGQELLKLVDEQGLKKILINFEGVEYLSSTMLGKLIALHKHVAQVKGDLKLCAIKPSIKEIFQITKLDKVFEIYETEQEAIRRFD